MTRYEEMEEEIKNLKGEVQYLRGILSNVSAEIKNDARNKMVWADSIISAADNSPMTNPDLRKEGVPVDLSKI